VLGNGHRLGIVSFNVTTAFIVLSLVFFGAVAIAVSIGVLLLQALFWLVTLPFRLLFWAISVPLFLLKALVLMVGTVLAGGVLIIGGLALAVTLLVAVALPLLPLAFVVFVTWALVRMMRRPVAA
jgi:hypothetical protein